MRHNFWAAWVKAWRRGVAPPTAAGPTLGPYAIEGEIGRGAMGAVLLGRDPHSGQAVALKTLALGDAFDAEARAEARARFLREAETARRLRHPGIVAVLAAGEDRGLAYIAMEYVAGHDLQRHAQAATLLPVPLLLRIAARVADALAHAHRQGVVHRDVKPANVIYDRATDRVALTDFGIASIADARRTRTGMVLGTPAFMSPEQLAGQRIDGRSDLYSLGAALFQLLCARLPHEAEAMAELMRQIAQQRAPDIRSLRPQLPPALAELLARLLEKQPELRPADGQQLARELRQIAAQIEAADATLAPATAGAPGRAPMPGEREPRHNPAE